jgi:hypothetical protein
VNGLDPVTPPVAEASTEPEVSLRVCRDRGPHVTLESAVGRAAPEAVSERPEPAASSAVDTRPGASSVGSRW